MSKGFVLTLDAMMAAILALIISALIMSTLSASNINYYEYQNLASVGNDLLAILDLTGKLDDYTKMTEAEGSNDLRGQLNVFPDHYCSNITVNLYQYNSGFQLDKTFSATKTGCTYPENKGKGAARRMYVDFDDERYGLAEMEIWLK